MANKKTKQKTPGKSSPSSSSCPFSLRSCKSIMFGAGINILVGVVAYYVYLQYFQLEPSAVIHTKLGSIVGSLGRSREGTPFSQYLGIPFALPPVDERRFEPPLPPLKWDGVKEMTGYKPICLQVETFATGMIFGKEDCLYLNVFVSHVGKSKKKPVMVYIHGGIFHVGGTDGSGPKYFMDEDVILVTIAYRLGVFGFLSTGDEVVPGNMGLKDQNMALRWIQENIEYFGGDPEKVTLFGESAGGASVHHHLISPMSKGLFSKIIHQSGSSINYWAVYRNVKEQARRFAGKFGCPLGTSKEIVDCLKGLDGGKLVAIHRELMDVYRPQSTTFVPTIEHPSVKSPFLTEEPKKILEEGRFPRISIMTGVISNEGQLISKPIIANQAKLNLANDDWEKWAPRNLHYPESLIDVTQKLKRFYFGSAKEINNTEFAQSYTDLFGDRLFIVRGSVAGRLEGKFTKTYLYYYDYSGSHNVGELLAYAKGDYLPTWLNIGIYLGKKFMLDLFNATPKKDPGNACHSDEIAMLFNRDFLYTISRSHPDYQMSRDMVKLWTSFASTDDSVLHFRGVNWHPISIPKNLNKTSAVDDDDGVRYLRISDDPAVIPEPFRNRRVFWESLNLPDL